MKKMKLMLYMLLWTTVSVSAQNIGLVRNGQYRITADLTPIKQEWEKLLVEQGLPPLLSDFTIQTAVDNVSGKTYYVLLGTNRSKSIKMARALDMKAGILSFVTKGLPGPQSVAICSGCSNGCAPVLSDWNWICEPSCAGEESQCVKTVHLK